MDFGGMTVVVTGAGSGIGRAVAEGFCSEGANVIGIGRTLASLEETAASCPGGRMRFVVGDVALQDDVRRLFAEASRLSDRVDVLVNNAALYPKVPFLESTQSEWGRVIEANVIGLAHCCRLALPGMLACGFGRIVNLGSLAWMGPVARSSAYSASKAAVRAFTKALATEVDRKSHPDILINELLPGVVRTRMSEQGLDPKAVFPHVRFVASLPSGGPTGCTFLQSELYVENRGLRARARRWMNRMLPGVVSRE